jgi:lipoprotein-anchoring transpeptidase ErfK/SrfK
MSDESEVEYPARAPMFKRLAAIAIGVTVGSLLLSHLLGSGSSEPSATAAPPAVTQPHERPLVVPKAPAGTTLVANIHAIIPGYASSGATKPLLSIQPTWHGESSALPVIGTAPGWVDVRLPQRPNGLTAWVKDTDVTFSSTPYKILVDLATRQLIVFKDLRLDGAYPAGIGTAADPTPTGQFFVAFFAAPPSAGYGPFVMVTSAHSNTISDWEDSGDALMAIHGPLGEDSAIGTTGAQISHGCVRLHIDDLENLRKIPAGTPIVVVAS